VHKKEREVEELTAEVAKVKDEAAAQVAEAHLLAAQVLSSSSSSLLLSSLELRDTKVYEP